MAEYIIELDNPNIPALAHDLQLAEIVRCKDCKHMLPKGYCHKNARKIPCEDYENWFCADGERKEGR